MRTKLLLGLCLGLLITILVQSCQSESELNYLRYYTSGKKLYEANCQNCHNNNGSGLAQLYPPLTDSVFLQKNKNQLACYIKYGLNGELQVAGSTYNGQMPAHPQLTTIEIAEIITYISNSFGNQQGLYDAPQVDRDLKNCDR